MDVSILVAYANLVTAPLLLMLALSKFIKPVNAGLRIGFITLAIGLFCQSFVVFVGLYQLDGWGQLWAVKDLGAGMIAICGVVHYIRLAFNNK